MVSICLIQQYYPDNMPNVEMKDIKQTFIHMYGGATIQSADADSSAFFYSFGLNGGYFKDYFSNKEPYVNFNISLSQLVKSFRLGIDAEFKQL